MAEITIPLRSSEEALLVLGPYDRHAKLLRQDLDIELFEQRGNLRLRGGELDVAEARRRIEHLLGKLRKGRVVDPTAAEAILLGSPAQNGPDAQAPAPATERAPTARATAARAAPPRERAFRSRAFEPRGERQRRYLETIAKKALTISIGPAGTGKTFLAVAAAVRALRSGECRRLIMTRPVVEAGEHLGFLPGDLSAKLNPYLRPVYDALRELIDFEDVVRLEETGVIEIAPLAYMRGRTLSQAFVILDEAQNTTIAQMKMFLTRLGEGSRMVVTGDPSQSDLDASKRNGLLDAVQRLQGFADVGVIEFNVSDVCRHPLVEQIVRAYEAPSRVPRPGQEDGG